MRSASALFNILSFVICVFYLYGCGDTKGGDHIPDFKTYDVATLSNAAFADGVHYKVFEESSVLRPIVYLADSYQICVLQDQYSEEAAANLSDKLTKQSPDVNASGLQIILNHALANIKKYANDADDFSNRIELNVVYDEENCSAVLLTAPSSEFPFTDADFTDKQTALFYPGQLRIPSGEQNSVPVAYVSSEAQDQAGLGEYAVAAILGLKESDVEKSKLNPEQAASGAATSFFVEQENGQIAADKDGVTVYAFALAFHDVLNPEDLGMFHYYADQIRPLGAEKDAKLNLPASVTNLTFVDKVGDVYVEGSRQITTSVKVCFDKGSADLDAAWYAEYLDFGKAASEPHENGSMFFELHGLDATFAAQASVATTGCNLMVSFRSSSDFPFNKYAANGLYFREGDLKASNGNATKIPVIYLNQDNLELDPEFAELSSNKYVGHVLQHEFAHYLGFKHSASRKSILSPAGYNDTWDMAGYDLKLFKRWIHHWSENR
jgi:hypothetical protein